METIHLIAIKTGQLHNRNNEPIRHATNAATNKPTLCSCRVNGPNFLIRFVIRRFIAVILGCFISNHYLHCLVRLFATNNGAHI